MGAANYRANGSNFRCGAASFWFEERNGGGRRTSVTSDPKFGLLNQEEKMTDET